MNSKDFLDKINQTPSPEKIIRIEWKKKDWIKVVVACSATESVNGSTVIKNGLIAFRYLKEGKGKVFDSLFRINRNDPIIIIENNKIRVFLSFCSFLLIFWINILLVRNIVGIISERPANPYTILGPGLSNILEIKRNVETNNGTLHSKILWSFLKNGKIRMNNPKGIIKNWFPPHDAIPKLNIIPPKIIFENIIFLLLEFIPLKNKYTPISP